MGYEETIRSLFAILSQANKADSEYAEPWQKANDASQSEFYGRINEAIKSIASPAIVEHWCETNEIDVSLSDRCWLVNKG